jgi:hypothetical protein
LQERVAVAGITIDECRLTHLAYAQEIAQAMLRRQQAEAVIAARQKIVVGAVSMVETALLMLSERTSSNWTTNGARRWCPTDGGAVFRPRTQPVVNAGTLYQ